MPSAIRTYLIGSPASLPALFVDNIPTLQNCFYMRTNAAKVMPEVESRMWWNSRDVNLKPTIDYHQHAMRTSPVPVISMIARADLKVPIQHFNAYYNAVAAAGCLGNYRSYTFDRNPAL